jgi:hypothetical protein
LARRKNRNVAIMAAARKLVTVAFLMLKHNEPYRYSRPELMREKFAALQRKGAATRSTPQSARQRRQGKPGLAEVYQAVGLPQVTCPEELSAGEQRMLTERELTEFVEELYRPSEGTRREKQGASGQQLGGTSRSTKRRE